jgi:L,D-transpeptidase ErfK/SrfK
MCGIWRIFLISLINLYSFNSLANDSLIGSIQYYQIEKDETLYDIARHFDLGISELSLANPDIDPWIPAVGARIILPTAHLLPDVKKSGIVINLAEARLYYFPQAGEIKTFPVSVGMDDSQTPLGLTKVVKKRKDPTWVPPKSIRTANPDLPEKVPPGDNNPLGQYAMNLESTTNFKWLRITIHGTNTPWSIGTPASHGCIRLYPEDIEVLFNTVPIGTAVNIINQPIKIGMVDSKLYIEAYPLAADSSNLLNLINKQVKNKSHNLNWEAIDVALKERNGIPISISY